MSSVAKVALESFALDATAANRKMMLRLTGTGDMVAIEPLKRCLVQVRSEMDRLKLERLEVDIRGLYLLNSSCIKAFVHFIYLVQTDGPSMSIHFHVDENLTWQARALAPLTRMAPDIVSVVGSR
ncbi:MAG TPA: hypothetical protein VKY73_16085 [Polyangiaceae bacterium]|nr:hypothetical protein [Polyangiaceae bacterium]